jgi:hypothetical protein
MRVETQHLKCRHIQVHRDEEKRIYLFLNFEGTKTNQSICFSTVEGTKKIESIRSSTIDDLTLLIGRNQQK